MVEHVGAGTTVSTTQTLFSNGQLMPGIWAMRGPFTGQTDRYLPGGHAEDPVSWVRRQVKKTLDSPLLTFTSIVGAVGALIFAAVKTHQFGQAKNLTSSLERRFDALDALLSPTNGRPPDEIRRIYQRDVRSTLEQCRRTASIRMLPTRKNISGDAIRTLHTQERARQALQNEMKREPENAAVIGQLLNHLDTNKHLEISANIILGRMASIAAKARGVRDGSAQWHALDEQSRQLEALCEIIEPSQSHLPAHLDLARRYVEAQVTLLNRMQGLPRFDMQVLPRSARKDFQQELQSFYACRQLNMAHYLPSDDSFFVSLGMSPTEARHFQIELASVQNARYRLRGETIDADRLSKAEKAALNRLLSQFDELFRRELTRAGARAPLSRTGRPRV